MPVDILIVDDDEMFRSAVKRQLEREGAFRVVGEAADGEECVRLARALRPEVVLMDVSMPRLDGFEATRRIKAERPEAKVIILTVHDEVGYRRAAVDVGADAYIPKKNFRDELFYTIRRIKRNPYGLYRS